MTILCYDGSTIAADRQITDGDTIIGYQKKILKWSGGYWTSAGRISDAERFKEWLEDRTKTFRPKKDFGAFYTQDSRVYEVDRELSPIEAMANTALGDGAEMATGFMSQGDTAVEAIRKVCKVNIYCSGKIDSIQVSE